MKLPGWVPFWGKKPEVPQEPPHLGPVSAPTREATPTTLPYSATPVTEPRVEIPTPAAGPKPAPNTTSGTGEKAA